MILAILNYCISVNNYVETEENRDSIVFDISMAWSRTVHIDFIAYLWARFRVWLRTLDKIDSWLYVCHNILSYLQPLNVSAVRLWTELNQSGISGKELYIWEFITHGETPGIVSIRAFYTKINSLLPTSPQAPVLQPSFPSRCHSGIYFLMHEIPTLDEYTEMCFIHLQRLGLCVY